MLAAALVALVGAGSDAAWAATCDENKRPITITETQQMNYGTIAVTNGGGTVTLSATGGVSAPGGFTVSGVTTPGQFQVSGRRNCALAIGFLAGFLTGPGAQMQIRNFTTNAGANPVLGNNGRLNFNVGADLVVNSSQAGGSYSGTYTVTVIY